MIQLAACDECEIIQCIVEPNNSRDHGIHGVFACRDCLKIKGWHQSMSDPMGDVDFYTGYAGRLTVSKIRTAQCPYGRQVNIRFAICVDCFKSRSEKMHDIAKLADRLKLGK